jgi:hypothetical protein
MLDKDLDKDLDLDLDDEDEGDGENGIVTMAELATLVPQPDAHASTPLDLARMGLSELAYIRRAAVNDVPMWTITARRANRWARPKALIWPGPR